MMTDTAQHALSHVVCPSQPSEMPHMMPETFTPAQTLTDALSLPTVSAVTMRVMADHPGRFACGLLREASDVAMKRPALYETCWASAHTPEAKHRRALEMHEAGYTLTEIAREVGYSGKSGAQYAIRQARAQRETREVA